VREALAGLNESIALVSRTMVPTARNCCPTLLAVSQAHEPRVPPGIIGAARQRSPLHTELSARECVQPGPLVNLGQMLMDGGQYPRPRVPFAAR